MLLSWFPTSSYTKHRHSPLKVSLSLLVFGFNYVKCAIVRCLTCNPVLISKLFFFCSLVASFFKPLDRLVHKHCLLTELAHVKFTWFIHRSQFFFQKWTFSPSSIVKCQASMPVCIISLCSLRHITLTSLCVFPHWSFCVFSLVLKVHPSFLSPFSATLSSCQSIPPGHLGEPGCCSHWSCSDGVCPSWSQSVAEAMESSCWAALWVLGRISSSGSLPRPPSCHSCDAARWPSWLSSAAAPFCC